MAGRQQGDSEGLGNDRMGWELAGFWQSFTWVLSCSVWSSSSPYAVRRQLPVSGVHSFSLAPLRSGRRRQDATAPLRSLWFLVCNLACSFSARTPLPPGTSQGWEGPVGIQKLQPQGSSLALVTHLSPFHRMLPCFLHPRASQNWSPRVRSAEPGLRGAGAWDGCQGLSRQRKRGRQR